MSNQKDVPQLQFESTHGRYQPHPLVDVVVYKGDVVTLYWNKVTRTMHHVLNSSGWSSVAKLPTMGEVP